MDIRDTFNSYTFYIHTKLLIIVLLLNDEQ